MKRQQKPQFIGK